MNFSLLSKLSVPSTNILIIVISLCFSSCIELSLIFNEQVKNMSKKRMFIFLVEQESNKLVKETKWVA